MSAKKSDFEQGFDHCYDTVMELIKDLKKEFKLTPESVYALRMLEKEIKRTFK